jgi:magnesium transporter
VKGNVKGKSSRQRRKPRFHRRTQPGAAPGTLRIAPGAPQPVVQVMAYDGQRLVEASDVALDRLPGFLNEFAVTWIDVAGLGDPQALRRLGELFGVHPLALEDVVNVHQRAKVEAYSDHLFIVTRLMSLAAQEHLESEQISLFLGRKFVLTFQQRPGDCFDPLRERIRKGHGKTRDAGPDYLAYALVDAVIDSYFPVVERYADLLDDLEESVTLDPHQDSVNRIHEVRNDLLLLRRSIRPHREAMNALVRDPHPLVSEETRFFFRDCYDHTIQVIDLLEIYREMCADLRDFYLSIASNRMNEIMKVLTIISTIFIPLSFITGLYGMNFDTALPGNMPELEWPYGYVAVLLLMSTVAGGMLSFFWRRGWIGRAWRLRAGKAVQRQESAK